MKIKLLLGAFAFIGLQSGFAQEINTTTVIDSKTVCATIDLKEIIRKRKNRKRLECSKRST